MGIFENFLRGQQAAQAQALNQLKLQQAQQMFPVEQQLKQLALDRAQQEIEQSAAMAPIDLATAEQNLLLKQQELVSAMNPGFDLDIKSTRIFDDGTMVSQTDRGPAVFAPDGSRLTGKAADEQIKRANQFETTLQRERSLGRESAQQSIELSGKAFEQLPLIRKNIGNLDDAIRLIGEGAATGTIMSRLPSVKQASIELDNLQAQLGLDVIGSTTFGALSGDELNFALDTALPKKLKGPKLTAWLEKKRRTQTKLAEYIQDAAIYLGRGGTVADFIELQRNIQESGLTQEERRFEEPEEPAKEVQRSSIGSGRKARRDRGQQPQQELSIEALVDQYAD